MIWEKNYSPLTFLKPLFYLYWKRIFSLVREKKKKAKENIGVGAKVVWQVETKGKQKKKKAKKMNVTFKILDGINGVTSVA